MEKAVIAHFNVPLPQRLHRVSKENHENSQDSQCHLPYSKDLYSSDFILLMRLKSVLKGYWFTSAEEVTAKVTRALTEVSEIGFQKCFQKLYEHCQKGVIAQGDYSEANGV
jgi:hypothetical protein